MNTQPTTTDATDTPKIKRRPYLNTRPEIDEERLPFVGKVKRKAKNGKYQTKTHYWRVQKGADPIEGLQYAVDFMDIVKANQNDLQAGMLIKNIFQDIGSLNAFDAWSKYEFIEFIGAALNYAAKHCNYELYAEKRLEELLMCSVITQPDESQATGGAA